MDENARDARKKEILAKRTADRDALLKRLWKEDADKHSSRLEKCGHPLRLKCCDCRAQRTAMSRCDLKWCPSCAPRLAHDRVKKYEEVVSTFRAPLFCTFTTRNFSARSKTTTGMREVVRAFRRFRSQRWFKRVVRAGVATFEMTRKKKGWHPHVHALIDSDWFTVTVPRPGANCTKEKWKATCRAACKELAEMWTLALGGRDGSVDIRKVTKRAGQTIKDALRETMKYSVTAESLGNITGDLGLLLDELSLTRNLVAFLGAYRHPALKKHVRESQPCDCCGAFGTLLPAEIVERFHERERKRRR